MSVKRTAHFECDRCHAKHERIMDRNEQNPAAPAAWFEFYLPSRRNPKVLLCQNCRDALVMFVGDEP